MDTYNDIYLKARKKLRAAGIVAHDLEARLIISAATGKTREELVGFSRLFVTDSSISNDVDAMISRRLNGEPVAYIVGEWEFYGMPLVVNRTVLIPRIDTEVLAREAIRMLRLRGGKLRMLDLCTGSGAVGLAVAANIPDCRVVLADSSDDALAICRTNMLRTRLSRNTTAINVDVMDRPPALLGIFDAIVCNPPYIPTKELMELDMSVRDYEPVTALDGGEDGLDFFRAIIINWPTVLREDGFIAFECGIGQASQVKEMMLEKGFTDVSSYYDTLEIERVIIGKRQSLTNV